MGINLTGTWSNYGDGGTYKLLQIGGIVYWRGVNPTSGWSNIGYGAFDEMHNTISISWADPDGANVGNHGLLFFSVMDNNTLKKLTGSGGGDMVRIEA